jgi:outer membrane protein OmpA-like peptidoglycan-associated protein
VYGPRQRDSAIGIEVQGHTDNVGGDQYNLTLSQARADAVTTWLGGHGIAATRLSAKGYGRNQPIADNDSDEGRAKNRRVVLAKTGCQK